MNASYRDLIETTARAHKISVLSGAGLSVESGVPAFRGPQGLWRNYDPFELATPEAFERDPTLVWEFYNDRRRLLAQCEPNAAHVALVDLEGLLPELVHITQNVDGLAARAGGKNIIRLHGELGATKCSHCGRMAQSDGGEHSFPAYCQNCGGLLRPGVVWFGEPVSMIGQAAQDIHDSQVFMVIGTSAVVQPAASLARLAKQQGAFVADFNLEETAIADLVDAHVRGPVATTLPAFVSEVKKLR
ncbi:MAG: NAD-dependent deacylase [Candidatus Lernaella stagnicola]|nr:NAD-dependent deacylase [Candidatus Lernaella stagnicola]